MSSTLLRKLRRTLHSALGTALAACLLAVARLRCRNSGTHRDRGLRKKRLAPPL